MGTAGAFDADAELKIWVSGGGLPFTKELNRGPDVAGLQQYLAFCVFGGSIKRTPRRLSLFSPMRRLLRVLSLSLAVPTLALLSGCISPPANTNGLAYINGGIRLWPLEKMPPLKTQEIDHLGLVMQSSPSVGVQTVAATVFGNQTDVSSEPLLSDQEKRQLFVEAFGKAAEVTITDIGEAREVLLPAIKFSAWSGKPSLQRSPEVEARVATLRAQGIDALLCVYEERLTDFIGMTNQPLQSQGLYRRFDTTAAYGGFDACIIDLRTFTLLPAAQYTQAISRPFTEAPWKERLADYSPQERAAIAEALREVLRANAAQAATMLKAHAGAR